MEVFFQYLPVLGPLMVAGAAQFLHSCLVGHKKSDARDQIDVLPDPDRYSSYEAWASRKCARRR